MQDGKYLKLISSTYKTVKAERNLLTDIADAFTAAAIFFHSRNQMFIIIKRYRQKEDVTISAYHF